MGSLFICFLVLIAVHILNASTDCAGHLTSEYYLNCVPNAGVAGAKELLESVNAPIKERNEEIKVANEKITADNKKITTDNEGELKELRLPETVFELHAYPVEIVDYDDRLDDRTDCADEDPREPKYTYTCYLVELCYADSCNPANKDVFLLQHGLLDSSDTWMMSSAGLAFQLAQAGKHVFMGNSRGNKYCLLPDARSSHNFWEFSWDDMATFDQPTFFSKIKSLTSDKLEVPTAAYPISYVGHSQGTIQMFAALSAGWIENEQIRHFYALAPVVAIWETTSKALKVAAKGGLLPDSVVLNQALEASSTTAWLVSKTPAWAFKQIFNILNYLFAGLTPVGLIDDSVKSKSPSYFPAGTSTRDVVHWNQLVSTGDFSPFVPPQLSVISSGLKIVNGTAARVASTEINSWSDFLTYGARIACRATTELVVSTVKNIKSYAGGESPFHKFYLSDGSKRCRWKYLESTSATTKPKYNLGRFAELGDLKEKISLFFGQYDALATPSGVKWIVDQIGLDKTRVYFYPEYDHVSFTWSQLSKIHIGNLILGKGNPHGVLRSGSGNIYIRGDKLIDVWPSDKLTDGWPSNLPLEADYVVPKMCKDEGLEELEYDLDEIVNLSF